MRSTTWPPVAPAMPHTYRMLTRCPRWSGPVGAGAKRVTGDAGSTRGSGVAVPVTAGTNSSPPPSRPLSVPSSAVARSLVTAAVLRLDGPGRGHDPPVDRQEVGLGHRPAVRHRDPEQHLALTLRVPDRAPAGKRLRAAGPAPEDRAFVEQCHDPRVQLVDPIPDPGELERGIVALGVRRTAPGRVLAPPVVAHPRASPKWAATWSSATR